MAKRPKPKRINFELIPPTPETGPYRIMRELREKFHESIREAKIVIAWRKSLKRDVDGLLVLGKLMKASDLQRELVDWDFVILLNKEVWNSPEFVIEKQRALMDHELCHAEVTLDKNFDPKVDERLRKVWRMRKHDIEEFRCIVERHGCYKADLEKFAEALLKSKRKSGELPFVADAAKGKGKGESGATAH